MYTAFEIFNFKIAPGKRVLVNEAGRAGEGGKGRESAKYVINSLYSNT